VRLVAGEPRRSDATVVRVRTRDGRVLERGTTLRDVRGTVFNPLSDAEMRAKFLANARRTLSDDRVAAAADAWERFAGVADVRDAMRTIR
jgi:hypothetical protein